MIQALSSRVTATDKHYMPTVIILQMKHLCVTKSKELSVLYSF